MLGKAGENMSGMFVDVKVACQHYSRNLSEKINTKRFLKLILSKYHQGSWLSIKICTWWLIASLTVILSFYWANTCLVHFGPTFTNSGNGWWVWTYTYLLYMITQPWVWVVTFHNTVQLLLSVSYNRNRNSFGNYCFFLILV